MVVDSLIKNLNAPLNGFVVICFQNLNVKKSYQNNQVTSV